MIYSHILELTLWVQQIHLPASVTPRKAMATLSFTNKVLPLIFLQAAGLNPHISHKFLQQKSRFISASPFKLHFYGLCANKPLGLFHCTASPFPSPLHTGMQLEPRFYIFIATNTFSFVSFQHSQLPAVGYTHLFQSGHTIICTGHGSCTNSQAQLQRELCFPPVISHLG